MRRIKMGLYVTYYENEKGQLLNDVHINDVGNEESKIDPQKKLLFIIEPIRLVSDITNMEKIEINLYWDKDKFLNKKSEAKFICDILRLANDLEVLRQYGTGFCNKDRAELQKYIESNYRQMDKKIDALVVDKNNLSANIQKIVEMIADNLVDNKYVAKKIAGKELYTIPVTTFSDWFNDSEYYYFNETHVRSSLRELGYTKCNAGRCIYNVSKENDKEKKEKVIAFYADCLKEIMEKENKA